MYSLVFMYREQFAKLIDPIVAVYRRAFDRAPEDEEAIKERLHKHRMRDGFHSVLAKADDGRVVGFAYGFMGDSGEWWHDTVRSHISEDKVNAWMDKSFEICELAVDPDFRGEGLGGRLLKELVSGVQANTALLSVRVDNAPALALYKKQGWQVLVEEVDFPEETTPYCVMGLELGKTAKRRS